MIMTFPSWPCVLQLTSHQVMCLLLLLLSLSYAWLCVYSKASFAEWENQLLPFSIQTVSFQQSFIGENFSAKTRSYIAVVAKVSFVVPKQDKISFLCNLIGTSDWINFFVMKRDSLEPGSSWMGTGWNSQMEFEKLEHGWRSCLIQLFKP